MIGKTPLAEATVRASETPDSRDSKRTKGRRGAERQAAYERLLDLPEEELSADGLRALEEGIEDFAAGRTVTREEIEREFGA